MTQYNMLEAKNNLSKICNSLISQEEDFVVICKDGVPVVKMIPYTKNENRIFGILKGTHECPKDFDLYDKEIEELFSKGE